MAVTDPESRKRLDQFVDAAFGFAVTLLVILGAQPETLDDLYAALFNIPASAAAFVLIVLFWQAHKVFARLTPNRDNLTTLISLAIVFMVLVYVFPLKLLTQGLFHWISGGRLPGREMVDGYGDLSMLFQIYGLGFAVLSALYAWLFARSKALAPTGELAEDARSWRDSWIVCAGAGLLSTLLAILMPLEYAPWLPPTMYSLIPLPIWIRERMVARARAAAALAAAPVEGQA
jgi:uncharacterized membrane protein